MFRICNVPGGVVLKVTVYTNLPFPLIAIVHAWLGFLHGYPWCCIGDFVTRYIFDLLPSQQQYGEGCFTPCPFHAAKMRSQHEPEREV